MIDGPVSAVLLILITLTFYKQSKECQKPDVVYITFGFKKSKYLVEQRIEKNELGVEYVYDYGREMNVFIQKTKPIGVSDDFIESVTTYSPLEITEIGTNWLHCYKQNIKEGDPILVPDWNNIFPEIFLIEKRSTKYYMSKVSWTDIELD